MSRLAAWRGRIATLALLALAAWEVTVLLAARTEAPTDDDWARTAEVVSHGWQPGDLVVFAPTWIDPVGRKWLGDLLSIDDAARMDAARYQRIWEVSARNASAPEARGTPTFATRFGALRITRFERPAPRVTWDLGDRASLNEVGFSPRKCVLVGTLREGSPPASLAIADATLGTELVAYAGLADFRTRRENQGRALVRILVDGAEISRALVDNDSGWLALPPAATATGVHEVRFEASVDEGAKHPVKLAVCVAAEARTP